MKREKTNIKKIIKAKINLSEKKSTGKPILTQKRPQVITARERIMEEYRETPIKKHSKQDTAYHLGSPNVNNTDENGKPIPLKSYSKQETAYALSNPNSKKPEPIAQIPKIKKPHVDIPVVLKDYGTYVKKEDVEVDLVICVCSVERYDKVKRLLDQIYSQETKYTFQFNLMDDGSFDERYKELPQLFPKLNYIRNVVNGGKMNYWRTVNRLWSIASKKNSHAFMQIDDDFILCENFIDRAMDEFFKKKEENNQFMVFTYHVYGYDRNKPPADWWYNGVSIAIDGGTIFDSRFASLWNFNVNIGERYIAEHTSTFVWDTIVQYIRDFGVRVYRFPKSLAWHDGNFDSKLHFETRKIKKSYTKNFIDGDDKYDLDKEFNEVA
jgi:hypothetical protein